jgi:hypothetical protein
MEGGVAAAPHSPTPWSRTRVHVDSPNPRIVEGAPGSQGRAGLATLALVALTLVALAGRIAAASALVMIAATIVTLSVTSRNFHFGL